MKSWNHANGDNPKWQRTRTVARAIKRNANYLLGWPITHQFSSRRRHASSINFALRFEVYVESTSSAFLGRCNTCTLCLLHHTCAAVLLYSSYKCILLCVQQHCQPRFKPFNRAILLETRDTVLCFIWQSDPTHLNTLGERVRRSILLKLGLSTKPLHQIKWSVRGKLARGVA